MTKISMSKPSKYHASVTTRECTICMQSVEISSFVSPGCHSYCKSCWKRMKKCPSCRRSVAKWWYLYFSSHDDKIIIKVKGEVPYTILVKKAKFDEWIRQMTVNPQNYPSELIKEFHPPELQDVDPDDDFTNEESTEMSEILNSYIADQIYSSVIEMTKSPNEILNRYPEHFIQNRTEIFYEFNKRYLYKIARLQNANCLRSLAMLKYIFVCDIYFDPPFVTHLLFNGTDVNEPLVVNALASVIFNNQDPVLYTIYVAQLKERIADVPKTHREDHESINMFFKSDQNIKNFPAFFEDKVNIFNYPYFFILAARNSWNIEPYNNELVSILCRKNLWNQFVDCLQRKFITDGSQAIYHLDFLLSSDSCTDETVNYLIEREEIISSFTIPVIRGFIVNNLMSKYVVNFLSGINIPDGLCTQELIVHLFMTESVDILALLSENSDNFKECVEDDEVLNKVLMMTNITKLLHLQTFRGKNVSFDNVPDEVWERIVKFPTFYGDIVSYGVKVPEKFASQSN